MFVKLREVITCQVVSSILFLSYPTSNEISHDCISLQEQLDDLPKIYVPPRIQPRAEPEQKAEEEANEEKTEKEAVPSLNTVTRETNQLLEVNHVIWHCFNFYLHDDWSGTW